MEENGFELTPEVPTLRESLAFGITATLRDMPSPLTRKDPRRGERRGSWTGGKWGRGAKGLPPHLPIQCSDEPKVPTRKQSPSGLGRKKSNPEGFNALAAVGQKTHRTASRTTTFPIPTEFPSPPDPSP